MWTPEECTRVQQFLKSIVPGMNTHALLYGLQVIKGLEAVGEDQEAKMSDVLS